MSQITLTQEPSRKRRRASDSSSTSKRKKSYGRSSLRRISRHDGEKHFHDTYNITAVDTTPIVTYISLADIPQGDTDLTRTGDKVQYASMQLRFVINRAVLTIGTNTIQPLVRLVLFQWMGDDNIDLPNTSDAVFQDVSTNARALVTMYNHDYGHKYKILRDKTYTLQQQVATATAVAGVSDAVINPQISDKWMIMPREYKERRVRYAAAGTTGTGKIYLALISDSPNGSGSNVSMYTRLNFYG